MKKRQKIQVAGILALVCLVSFLCSGEKKNGVPVLYRKAIAAFIEFATPQMQADRIPGLSIGFIKGDIMWAEGFGFADLENKVPATAESAYRLASITKTMTAIAVLQLVEAGKIDLDAEVQTYVPYFPRKRWPVTVRQTLGHLGGISHYRDYDREGHFKDHKDTREALAVFQDFDLVAEPGTRYHYSSYGFNLLGAVIEGASGQPYGEFIQENIFTPLGMTASRLDSPEDLIPRRVRGYRILDGRIKNSEFVDISSRFGGGGTRSTVVDLLKYARGICAGKLLKAETWKLMFTSMAIRSGWLTGYGMGWNVRPWRGHFQVSHGGAQAETRTHIIIFPLEDFAIAVGANLEGSDLMPYVRRLAELILDEDMDSQMFLPDRTESAIHEALFQTFSYGLSRYLSDRSFVEDKRKQEAAFSYFNSHVDSDYLQKHGLKARRELDRGVHPVSAEAFTRVGAHMAAALEAAQGRERLEKYRHNPLDFFSDYAGIAAPRFKLSQPLSALISAWREDLEKTYTREERNLRITAETDLRHLGKIWKARFAGSRIYPDFSAELELATDRFIEDEELSKSLDILQLSSDLYPDNPTTLLGLAVAHFRSGDIDKAAEYYKKSHALRPVGIRHFASQAQRLQSAEKIAEMSALADIAVGLYPKSSRLHREIADVYTRAGQRELAVKYYRKTLEIDPKSPGIKEKLDELIK